MTFIGHFCVLVVYDQGGIKVFLVVIAESGTTIHLQLKFQPPVWEESQVMWMTKNEVQSPKVDLVGF